jgi:hypothetical protein
MKEKELKENRRRKTDWRRSWRIGKDKGVTNRIEIDGTQEAKEENSGVTKTLTMVEKS